MTLEQENRLRNVMGTNDFDEVRAIISWEISEAKLREQHTNKEMV